MNLFPQGIMIVNKEAKLKFMNTKCERLLNVDTDEDAIAILRDALKKY